MATLHRWQQPGTGVGQSARRSKQSRTSVSISGGRVRDGAGHVWWLAHGDVACRVCGASAARRSVPWPTLSVAKCALRAALLWVWTRVWACERHLTLFALWLVWLWAALRAPLLACSAEEEGGEKRFSLHARVPEQGAFDFVRRAKSSVEPAAKSRGSETSKSVRGKFKRQMQVRRAVVAEKARLQHNTRHSRMCSPLVPVPSTRAVDPHALFVQENEQGHW